MRLLFWGGFFSTLLGGIGCGGVHRRENEVPRPTPPDAGVLAPARAARVLSGPIAGVEVVPRGANVLVDETLVVRAGGQLQVEAGAKLSFRRGAGLILAGGTLLAHGTDSAPIRFTSAESQPRPGDWTGIVAWEEPQADGSPSGPSVIEHATVEYGGACWSERTSSQCGGIVVRATNPERQAALTRSARHQENTLILQDVLLSFNEHVGLWSEHPDLRTHNLHFRHNGGLSARIYAHQVPSLGQAPDEAVEVFSGMVTESMQWPNIPGGYNLTCTLTITSANGIATHEPAVLTIERGSTVRVPLNREIEVGSMPGWGKLVAHGVTFTAIHPYPGSWRDLVFMGPTTFADLEDNVFEYGGTEKSPVLTFWGPPENYNVQRNRFRFTNGSAIGLKEGTCEQFLRNAKGNSSDGARPLCVKVR